MDGVLDGTLQREVPTLGKLPDGSALFYSGRINQVLGDSNAGKSWTALLTSLQELQAGQHVLFFDFEDSPQGILTRLLDMGATREQLVQCFHYVRPDTSFDVVAAAAVLGLVRRVRPTLAVVDSTGESLAVEGKNPNADEEVALWFRGLPRQLADAGCCVLLLDHLPKASDGKFAIGRQRKRAAITGASYMQKMVEPFSRERAGHSSLTVAKYRLGNGAQDQDVANLCVNPFPTLAKHLAQFTVPAAETRPNVRAELRERVVAHLRQFPGETKNQVQKSVKGDNTAISSAIADLVDEGLARTEPGPNGGHRVYLTDHGGSATTA